MKTTYDQTQPSSSPKEKKIISTSLRELETPKPPVMPSRDRSWGRSQQPLNRGGREASATLVIIITIIIIIIIMMIRQVQVGGHDPTQLLLSRLGSAGKFWQSWATDRPRWANHQNTFEKKTKVVGHSGSGKLCAACEKPLTDDGFFAMGTLFHQACFRYRRAYLFSSPYIWR